MNPMREDNAFGSFRYDTIPAWTSKPGMILRKTYSTRLPGARRFAAEAASANGIEVPDELLAQIDKLCST
jgi:hypothetical protein